MIDSSVKVIGKHAIAVDIPVLKINELVGGLSCKTDDISVAMEKAAGNSGDENFKTCAFDEWLCVLTGKIVCKIMNSPNEDVVVGPGETVFIKKDSVWKPMFPESTEFIAVCKPAFRPDRVKMVETSGVAPAIPSAAGMACAADPTREYDPELLYHMTTVALWKEAVEANTAYYPPTFEADGLYTHATAVPSRLVATANHFYQDTEGDWLCLEFTRSALKKCGIIVKDEQPLPVGDKPVSDEWVQGNWICPHVYGGIPPSVVVKTYPMIRNGKTFTGIQGLN